VSSPKRPVPNFGSGLGSGFQFDNIDEMTKVFAGAGRSVANFAKALPAALRYAATGPERQTSGTLGILPSRLTASLDSNRPATTSERFTRDNILGEQERKLGWEAAQEGRPVAAAGWYAMSALPLTPFIRGVGNAGTAAARTASATPPARVVNEPFPVRRVDELLDRTPIQVEIPVQYRETDAGYRTRSKGPSTGFGNSAPRVEAQIYRGPDGNYTYGSPHDVTIRTPLSSSDVGFRSRNPFEATGINPRGVGADDIMQDYASAVEAARRAGVPTTDIDALLYLARGGNAQARDLFQGAARSGPGLPMLDTPTSSSFDNIVLAHSTSRPTRINTRGEGLLRAGGDYRSGTSAYNVPTEQLRHNSNAYFPWRNSLHFTQNSRVAEAPLAGSWQANRNFTLARLNDVIEANPGSLGNLNPADTFFFPGAGKPLILPNARTVELPPAPTGFHQRKWLPEERFTFEDGTTSVSPGRYSHQFNHKYNSQVDEILGNEARSLGGEWYGIRGEDGLFPQREILSDYMRGTGTPLVGHARGSLPGHLEMEASENFYRAGLGIQDNVFDSALHNAMPRELAPYVSPPTREPREFWRRLLSGNNLTGGRPIRFDPFANTNFNF